MSDYATQKEKVLYHLKHYRSLTSWEAIKEYHVTRLSAVIFDLREKGYNIKSIREENLETGTRFVRYYLLSEPK